MNSKSKRRALGERMHARIPVYGVVAVADALRAGDVELGEDRIAVHAAALAPPVPLLAAELDKLAQEDVVQAELLRELAACMTTCMTLCLGSTAKVLSSRPQKHAHYRCCNAASHVNDRWRQTGGRSAARRTDVGAAGAVAADVDLLQHEHVGVDGGERAADRLELVPPLDVPLHARTSLCVCYRIAKSVRHGAARVPERECD